MRTKRTPPNRPRPSPVARIGLQVACSARGLPGARRLRALARAAAAGGADITLRVVGAAEARRLNRAYRGRDYATNVLSFDYGAPPAARRRRALRGDVVLCHPVLAREARAQGKTLGEHYAHLVVHGVLHLRGFDHRRASEAVRMERREARILRRFGVADPYLVR
ncbi:MAG: rRNA maturation RNase YbeY [Betaproteobacteria bacterium]|nr:MAG: rRNA maturation RNase YbeY [Betaproteobacteria bacterium]TAN54672.1 MAG: rRNA maturation RNase YbeY [Betaproteobacteria bacterium]